MIMLVIILSALYCLFLLFLCGVFVWLASYEWRRKRRLKQREREFQEWRQSFDFQDFSRRVMDEMEVKKHLF